MPFETVQPKFGSAAEENMIAGPDDAIVDACFRDEVDDLKQMFVGDVRICCRKKLVTFDQAGILFKTTGSLTPNQEKLFSHVEKVIIDYIEKGRPLQKVYVPAANGDKLPYGAAAKEGT